MAKFGRFEFGKTEPTETYEGDYMKLDAKGYVSIFRNDPSTIMGVPTTEPRLIHAIHLDKGQSVREIKE